MFFPIWIDEIGKNQDKSINETSVSSISADWSIESISIKSLNDFSRFIDWQIRYRFLSIHYSGSPMCHSTVSLKSILRLDNSILNFFLRLPTMWIPTPCRYRRQFLLRRFDCIPQKIAALSFCKLYSVSFLSPLSMLRVCILYTHPVSRRWSFNLNSGQNPLVSLITAFLKKDRVTIAHKEWLNHFKCTHVLSIHMVIKMKATPICCSGV